MNARSRGKQFVRHVLDAPGINSVLVALARNRWLLPRTLRSHLETQVRVRQSIVSAWLPGGDVLRLWHDELSADVTKRILLEGFAGSESGTPVFFADRYAAKPRSYSTSVPMSALQYFGWPSNPKAKVIAFEPVPQLYTRLVREC